MYHGDIALGETIDIKFTTRQFSTGAPFTLAGTPVISAYVDNGTTEITAGITLTVDFDSRTGLNNVRVVATSGNGFVTATNVTLVITTGTVDSVSVVGECVGSFSIEKRSAVRPTTAGRTLTIESDGMAHADLKEMLGVGQSVTDLKDFADDGYDPATNKVQGVVLVDTTTTNTDMRGTDSAATAAALATHDGKLDTLTTTVGAAGAGLTEAGGTGDHLTAISATLKNGAHGGTAAVLTLERMIVASATTNEPGIKITGNGSGPGLQSTGGATGHGAMLNGGASDGDGLHAHASAGCGIWAEAHGGSNAGMTLMGDSAAPGLVASGGIQGSIDGDLSGSVGSVTGAVGSVTGAVGSVTGSVGSLATQAKADVNAEVVDALATDTYAEPGQGTPAATLSLAAKINYLFKNWRNRKTQTSTQWSLYNDDATTVDQKATVSDDGTTAGKTEISTGP